MIKQGFKRQLFALGLGLVVAAQGVANPQQMATAQAEGAEPITEDVFSGAVSEWSKVEHNEVNSEPNLIQLKAVSDGTYLYGYASAKKMSNAFEVYITVDGVDGVDMSHVWADAVNVSYKMDATGCLYRYDGAQWVDIGEKANVYQEERAVEFQIAISSLTEIGSVFGVAIMESETSVMPSKKQNMLEVVSPILTDIPEITADGNPSDWKGVEPIAEGEGAIGELYAVRSKDYLYVMSYVKEVDENNFQGFSTNLYINTDTNSDTGYQHAKYPAMNGAEFLVQDWCSIAVESGTYSPNTEYFYHEENSSAWSWTVLESGIDYKQHGKMSEDGVYCIEYKIPIADLKEKTPSIADDLYIAIDREWIEGTADESVNLPLGYAPVKDEQNGSFAKVPKYQTTFEISLEDSAVTDWNDIPNAVRNKSADTMYNMKATCSQERLYTLVTSKYGDFTTATTYYIDTDNNGGYAVDAYAGVDYIIKDARLYKVEADNALSDEICSVDMDYYEDSIEMQVYLEDLGNPETISIAFAGKGYDGNTYDDTTTPNKEMAIPGDGSYLQVTASFEMFREDGLYYPKESFDSFTNPYIGWAGWANQYGVEGSESAYDYDLAYVGIKWRELEPEKGVYDFEAIEELYHISELVADGKRINLRFIMDNPDASATEKCMDIPQWLYDELVEENGEEGAGTFYFREDLPGGIAGSAGSGFSPNYDSELLLKYHEKAIEALAKEFDDPSIVGYVQVGSIGHWAEFHTWPEGTGEFPTPEGAAKYMEPYTKYFNNVKLGIRKPYPYAAANGFGLFNDIFGVSQWADTTSFLKYIENGCTDMGSGATPKDIVNSKMPDFWKTNYSGGEFASGNVRLHLTDAGTIGCLQQVRDSHTSWLGPCSVTMLTVNDSKSYDYKTNVEAMQKLMGYRFSLRSVTQHVEFAAGDTIYLNMKWDNKGVAPMYYNWPMEISLIGENGEVAYSELKDVEITNWLPGANDGTVTFNIPRKLSEGNYTIAVAIADPETEEPTVKLAMEGGRDDLRYPLYQISVSGSNTVNIPVGGMLFGVLALLGGACIFITCRKRKASK